MLSVLLAASANVYDVTQAHYAPGCTHGCAPWASAASTNYSQADIDALFIGGHAAAVAAGSSCAMPGAHAGNHECDCGQMDEDRYMTDSYAGAWCFCLMSCQRGSKATRLASDDNCTLALGDARDDADTAAFGESPARAAASSKRGGSLVAATV